MSKRFPSFLFGSGVPVPPVFPVNPNVTEIFDFTLPAQVSPGTNGSLTNSITGTVQGLVWSETDPYRPTYHTSGGPNNLPYAQFVQSALIGDLPQTTTDYSFIVIRRLTGTQTQSAISLGTSGNGYGIADYVANAGVNTPGGFQQSVSNLGSTGSISTQNIWELYIHTHSAGVSKLYNISGYSLVMSPNNTNPSAPTGTGQLGFIQGGNVSNMDIAYAAVANAAISPALVNQYAAYFHYYFGLAYVSNISSGGDGIVTGAGLSPPFMLTSIQTLLPTKPAYWNNSAFDGATAALVLAGISVVTAAYNPAIRNIYFLMVGHVDISESIPASTIYAGITSIVNTLAPQGWETLISVPLISTNETLSPDLMAIYVALEALILANTAGATATYNPSARPDLSDPTNGTYFMPDGIHLTQAGANDFAVGLTPILNVLL